jgi:four helix bundle protein
MATVERFEDLLCWKKARELTREVYKVFKGNNDRGFTDQIQRASVSVMSNIAEGFESGTRQEFVNYLYIAKGSAGEVRAQLYAAYDIGYLNIQIFESLKKNAEECSRLLNSFIKAVKSSPHEGLQRRRGLTKREQAAEEFLADARAKLAKIHPHIYGVKP